jgi:hypothetical protein
MQADGVALGVFYVGDVAKLFAQQDFVAVDFAASWLNPRQNRVDSLVAIEKNADSGFAGPVVGRVGNA